MRRSSLCGDENEWNSKMFISKREIRRKEEEKSTTNCKFNNNKRRTCNMTTSKVCVAGNRVSAATNPARSCSQGDEACQGITVGASDGDLKNTHITHTHHALDSHHAHTHHAHTSDIRHAHIINSTYHITCTSHIHIMQQTHRTHPHHAHITHSSTKSI